MARKRERTGKAVQLELNLVPADHERLQAEIHRLRMENASLRSEVAQLRSMLQTQRVLPDDEAKETPVPEQTMAAELDSERRISGFNVTKQSDLQDKIALFRSFFRGREDVYALRGIDKTGKAGYFRAREYLGKENGRAVWGEDLPLTDEVIAQHLQREERPVTVGLYPLLTNETCWFLAVDFDKADWQEDCAAFLSVCRQKKVPAALERSRSGNGGHVWIFFKEPVAARTCRMLGSSLLTLALEHRHQIGLDSYDRMFPNQDTLPRDKKLGNLIALPLQRGPGKAGNSLFVDDHFQPYKDQWQFLSSLRKMNRMEVEALVYEAERKGSVLRIARASDEEDDDAEPWTATASRTAAWEGNFPARMKLVISDKLYIEKEGLTSSQINHLIRMAAFQNPDFYKAQKMRLSTFGKPRIINCSAEFSRHIALPRGCLEDIQERLQSRGVTVELVDERVAGQPLQTEFRAKLKDEQSKAATELLRYDTGILSATTAFGKTVIGAWMIAARGVSTLVLVHRTQLLEQWKAQLALFLTVPADEIGQLGGGRNKRTGRLDVAMLQSVHGREDMLAALGEYGQIIVDECHHISAFSFEQVLSRARSKYVLGLTATYVRKDGHHPIVSMQCGPVRYRVDAKSQAKNRPFRHVVLPRSTGFRIPEAEAADMPIQELYDRLIADERRNDQIFDDLLKALDQGRSPLLLTDRTAHLDYFADRLKHFAKNVIVLRGGMGKKRWREIQEQIRSVPQDQERVFLATGRFAGEGFDDARLDTLFLVTPISWKGTLQQYAGRLHRLYESKREVQIYDYVDQEVPKLVRMYAKRRNGYMSMGYIEETLT